MTNIYIVNKKTKERVETIDVTNQWVRACERVVRWMSINLNHDDYRIDSSEVRIREEYMSLDEWVYSLVQDNMRIDFPAISDKVAI